MDEPRAVLHVVDCLNVGGTERQLFELLRRLDRRKWRPLVACFKAKGELLPKLRELGIEPIEFKLPASLPRPETLLQIARMARLCRREKVRIVHAHDFYSNLIGVAAAGLARVRAIASRRDLAHWLSPVQRRGLKLALRFADCVIANSAAVGELAVATESLAREKLRVVPNGIDVAAFDALCAEKPDPPLEDSGGAPRLMMVASMHLPDKGHGDLLQVAATLRARGRKAQWLIVSDGVLRSALEAKARSLGVTDCVRFLGRRADVASLLARADLVVHPSWAEGFPNVILEAMVASRPVVATRVGGCPELITDGEHGFLVEPRRPEALAAAVERALDDPEAARAMGRRGRARAVASYSLDRMTQTVEALYAELAGAPRAAFGGSEAYEASEA